MNILCFAFLYKNYLIKLAFSFAYAYKTILSHSVEFYIILDPYDPSPSILLGSLGNNAELVRVGFYFMEQRLRDFSRLSYKKSALI